MRIIEKLANRLIRPTGYTLRSTNHWNCINVSVEPRTLIDVGCATASSDLWSAFPDARLLLLDPVAEHESAMRSAVMARGGSCEIVAVGSCDGETQITVNICDPEKSSLYERTALAAKQGRTATRQVPMKTLDTLVGEHAPEEPFGLKIDTEGNELEVILGASLTLRRCSFAIVEASVQARFVGSYEFAELISVLREQGFRLANVLSAEPDKDRLVRFMDLLFVPA